MKVYVAQLNPTIGDLRGNKEKVIRSLSHAKEKGADIVCFSELILCGYPPEDLLFSPGFVEAVEESLHSILAHTKDLFVVIGTVRRNKKVKKKRFFNSAAIIHDGKLLDYKDKTLLPTYDVFDERRYFEPGEAQKTFLFQKKKIAVLICEDMWQHAGELAYTHYEVDPVKELQSEKPDLLINISASPYYFQKHDMRKKIFAPSAKDLACPVVWCNQVGANDHLVFDGYSMVMTKKGELVASAKGFEEDYLFCDPFTEKKKDFVNEPIGDLFQALVLGVRDYFTKQGFSKAVIGLSGGVDSAVVAAIAKEALGCENILVLAMPSRFTSIESFEDARELADRLGITLQDVPVDHLFQNFLDLFSPYFYPKPFDQTEENIQARIRGLILMAFSNKFGHILLSTGNKSEMALGYTTLYGDMCGGLGVINDVKKSHVYELAKEINRRCGNCIPTRIIEKPPSAELRANQTDQDTLPSYDVVDTVLEEYLENMLSSEEIAKKHQISVKEVNELIRMIHLAEYKRRQSPISIRVSKKSFSKGRIFPVVQRWC